MAQFIVRDLEDDVKARLKRRAERHGRSMEEEVRNILRNATKEENRVICATEANSSPTANAWSFKPSVPGLFRCPSSFAS